MSALIPFEFENNAVRVINIDDAPWFVVKDVCEILGIGNPSQAITRLDDDEVTLISTEGNHRKTNIINESGLYALIFTSRKKAAQRFRKWVTSEVLPTLRRTGAYFVNTGPVHMGGR
jgi:anti-repressor protein